MVKVKATRRLNLLRRSMFYCSSLAKLRAYLSLVRPLMDYCSPVWSPYQHYLQHDLEIIQKRAARWICGARWDSSLFTWSRSYVSCMQQLHLLPVITRHQFLSCCQVFKAIHNLVCVPFESFFSFNTVSVSRFAHKYTLSIPPSNLDVFRYSFFVNIIFIWNSIPFSIVDSDSFLSFKSKLFHYLFDIHV